MEIKAPTAKRKTILLSAVLIIWPVILLCKVLIINITGLSAYRILLLLALSAWIVTTIYAVRKEQRVVVFVWVLSLLNVIQILYQNGSEKLFFGLELAKAYVAEAPGYSELTLYNGNNYRVGHGGILGDTDVFYGKYEMNDSIVWLDTEQSIFDLEGSSILINGTRRIIKQK